MMNFLKLVAVWTIPVNTLKSIAARVPEAVNEAGIDMAKVPDSWLPVMWYRMIHGKIDVMREGHEDAAT